MRTERTEKGIRIRTKCVVDGHRWIESINGFRLLYQFCKRWLCDASRASPEFKAAFPIADDIPGVDQ